jgi:hypothetical protein
MTLLRGTSPLASSHHRALWISSVRARQSCNEQRVPYGLPSNYSRPSSNFRMSGNSGQLRLQPLTGMTPSCDRSLAAPPLHSPCAPACSLYDCHLTALCTLVPRRRCPSVLATSPRCHLHTAHYTLALSKHAPLDAASSPCARSIPCRLRYCGLLCAATPIPCSYHLRLLHPASSARVWRWPCRSVPHPPAPPHAPYLAPQSHSVPAAQPYPLPSVEPLPHLFHIPPPPAHAPLSSPSPHTRPNPRPHLHLSPVYSPPSLRTNKHCGFAPVGAHCRGVCAPCVICSYPSTSVKSASHHAQGNGCTEYQQETT